MQTIQNEPISGRMALDGPLPDKNYTWISGDVERTGYVTPDKYH
jgi:hypothetical protein